MTDAAIDPRSTGWPTRVYWLHDYTGRLLYVGMGVSAHARLLDHARKKDWWPEVDPSRTVIRRYPTRDHARAAETHAIETEKPIHNVLGTPEHGRRMWEARRRMVAVAHRDPRPTIAFTGPIVGTAEIADRLGVSRQRVQQLIARADWPKPYVALAMGKVWKTEDIEAWIGEHRPNDPGPEEDERDAPLGRRHGRKRDA